MEDLADGACSMCGGTAVVTAMAYAEARGAGNWHLFDYRTSAQTSGDYGRVVGYGALAMERAA
jgi:AmmeMemoRadiSam system protein B